LNAIQINSTPTSPTHGGSTYTPSATATSGDPVIITSATPSVCTVSGGVVTFKMAGQCILNFNDPGNFNFAPATQVQQNFTVN